MLSEPPISRRLVLAGALVLTLALSLFLLGYVGWGEARRTCPRFELERLGAQGEIVSNSMDSFLLAGLPLEQFPGFTTVTQPLLDSDATVLEIAITDSSGRTVFRNAGGGEQTASVLGGEFHPVSLKQTSTRYRVTEDSRRYRVTIELRNKFETVGNLHLVMSKDVIDHAITAKAGPVAGRIA